jgi:type IV pilus assembly protein PilE
MARTARIQNAMNTASKWTTPVRRTGVRGFTLIEVMIVVAIVAILASVAYPSYMEYVARGRRTQLKTQMVAAQQWMERFYSESYRYNQNAAGTATEGVGGLFSQQVFSQSPPVGEGAAQYTLAVATGNGGQTYTITATRAGAMVADHCGSPSVTNTGIKGVVDGSFDATRHTTAAVAIVDCWR